MARAITGMRVRGLARNPDKPACVVVTFRPEVVKKSLIPELFQVKIVQSGLRMLTVQRLKKPFPGPIVKKVRQPIPVKTR
jgi:hypothetical protein